MYKPVAKEIKDEILQRIKAGQKPPSLAKQYGLSDKTIYNWLRNQVKPDVSTLEYNRLKRENEELKRIIGMIQLDLEQQKKRLHKS
jgi:DNA invertase Pin-like site-specific DNA recombinase